MSLLDRPRAAGDHVPARCVGMAEPNRCSRRWASDEGDGGDETAGAGGAGARPVGAGEAGTDEEGEAGAAGAIGRSGVGASWGSTLTLRSTPNGEAASGAGRGDSSPGIVP
jgi:hypothetical protein